MKLGEEERKQTKSRSNWGGWPFMQLEMLMLARFTIGCKTFTNGTAISVVGTSRKILLELSFE